MATVSVAKTQPQKGLQDIFQVRNMPLNFRFRKLGLADKIAVMGTKIPPYLHYSHYYNIIKKSCMSWKSWGMPMQSSTHYFYCKGQKGQSCHVETGFPLREFLLCSGLTILESVCLGLIFHFAIH